MVWCRRAKTIAWANPDPNLYVAIWRHLSTMSLRPMPSDIVVLIYDGSIDVLSPVNIAKRMDNDAYQYSSVSRYLTIILNDDLSKGVV